MLNCLIEEFGSELSEGNEDEMKTFNQDIVCSHGAVPSLASVVVLTKPFNNYLVTIAVTYLFSCHRGSEYSGDRTQASIFRSLDQAQGVLP